MVAISLLFIACMAAITSAQIFLPFDTETTGVSYGGFITVYGSVIAIIIGRQIETKAAYERGLREKKMVIYQELTDNLLNFDPSKEATESDGVKSARAMTRSLITWGSDEALKKWINYIVALRGDYKHQGNPEEELRRLLNRGILDNFLDPKAEAILVIRKELGHENKGLSKDDILDIFVPYIRELRRMSNATN